MPKLAEKLGFDADDRIAVVHADDIGMCHAANVGAYEALQGGPASCGSIMVPCGWFQEAADHARANPDLDIGVHLTLNAEWEHYRWGPVAGRDAVPSLLDDQGFLPRTSLEVAQHAKPEEVYAELRAQVQMCLDAGVDVTHLDSHMGTCFFPPFIPVYQRLADEFKLPVFAAHPDDDALAAAGMAGAGPIIRNVVASLEQGGFPVLDHFDANSLDFTPGTGAEHNGARLDSLKTGVNYLICHPAQGGDELDHITPDSAHQRDFERGFYGGEAGAKALSKRSIRTVGMRPLRALLRGE